MNNLPELREKLLAAERAGNEVQVSEFRQAIMRLKKGDFHVTAE